MDYDSIVSDYMMDPIIRRAMNYDYLRRMVPQPQVPAVELKDRVQNKRNKHNYRPCQVICQVRHLSTPLGPGQESTPRQEVSTPMLPIYESSFMNDVDYGDHGLVRQLEMRGRVVGVDPE